jgi:hypothetical protein
MVQGQHTGIDAAFPQIADRIRTRESSFHSWDRPTKTPCCLRHGGLSPAGDIQDKHSTDGESMNRVRASVRALTLTASRAPIWVLMVVVKDPVQLRPDR